MVEQVQGYLMRAKNFWEHFREGLTLEYDGNNYQIFFPEFGGLLGYFVDKDLNLSKEKFYEPISSVRQLECLDAKVARGKFVKMVSVDKDVLNFIESAENELVNAKAEVKKRYNSLTDFFNHVKSQKSLRFLRH